MRSSIIALLIIFGLGGMFMPAGLHADQAPPSNGFRQEATAGCADGPTLSGSVWSAAGAQLFDPDVPPASSLVGLVPVDSQAVHTLTSSKLPVYPDTLLLFSNDWYGERLAGAARELGLSLTSDQLDALETAAMLHGVNTRLLLVVAALSGQGAPPLSTEEWPSWLAMQVARARAALGPHPSELMRVVSCNGDVVVPSADTATLGLMLMLSPLAATEGADSALRQFHDLYAQVFGDPALDEATQQTLQPFLIHPFFGAALSHSYYDHTYPSVDNSGSPNVAGMLDYLGRRTTGYDTHDGDDFGLTYGTTVIAPAGGKLYNRLPVGASDGGVVIVSGSFEIVIWHMSAVLVGVPGSQVGTSVTQGQLIGRSGAAGGLAHIHVEARYNGRQIDTMGWYGTGPDPCPLGPAGGTVYKGCVASVWLWRDTAPPFVVTPSVFVYFPVLRS